MRGTGPPGGRVIHTTRRLVPPGLILHISHEGFDQPKTSHRDDSGRIYRPSCGQTIPEDGCANLADGAWILETKVHTAHYLKTVCEGRNIEAIGQTRTTRTKLSPSTDVEGSILQTQTNTFHATCLSRTP
jgi:hypothetical protein